MRKIICYERITVKNNIMSFLLFLVLPLISLSTSASTLEDLVRSKKTVEEKFSEATLDITDNVLIKYQDNIQVGEPTLKVLSTSNKSVDIEVSYEWAVPRHVLEEIRETLGKYFLTTLSGPKVTVGTYNCHGHVGSEFCDIKEDLGWFLKSKSVGTEMKFLGSKTIFSYNNGSTYHQSGRYSTIFTVDREAIKGNPDVGFATKVYNISGCTPFVPTCNIKGVYRE